MKKLIALTVLLLTAIVLVTWLYFKNLNLPEQHTARLLQSIPADAALILNFNNEDSFYDMYDSSALFTSLADTEQLHELRVLKQQFMQPAAIKPLIADQPVYISVHPGGNLLLTIPAVDGLSLSDLQGLLNQSHQRLQCTPLKIGKLGGLSIRIAGVNRPFTLVYQGGNVFSGSFSREVITGIAAQLNEHGQNQLISLHSAQQNNALANLYINYTGLAPLITQWFKNSNTGFFKPLATLPANAALTLNYKRDALMFSGYTTLNTTHPATYLTLFENQKPYRNQLKNIFPLITAYSTCYSLSDPARFQQELADWQARAGLTQERQTLFAQIKKETGVDIGKEFNNVLSNEFAVLTTRFDEQLAIIQVKNGQSLQPVLNNIGTVNADSSGRLNYAKLPYLLLGDALSGFRQPYYMVIDNYLVLANSAAALASYRKIYARQSFLSRNEQFNTFDNLLAEQCNVSFYLNYNNAARLLKRDIQPAVYNVLYPQASGANGFSAAAYQLSGAGQQFYTNFCMQLNQRSGAAAR
ncbi:hypothetical protein [Mucilaginibacter sp.]